MKAFFLALVGTFLLKELLIIPVFETNLYKKPLNLVLGLFMNMSAK